MLTFIWLYNFDLAHEVERRHPRWHYELIQVLNTGTIAEADAAMREHIHTGLEEIINNWTEKEIGGNDLTLGSASPLLSHGKALAFSSSIDRSATRAYP